MNPTAERFIKTFIPYRKMHLKQTLERNLFGNEPIWIRKGYLTEYLIHKALLDHVTLAYFKTTWTDSFGLDIDVHEWNGLPLLAPILQKTVDEAVKRIGKPPSIAVESPHGIHLYYFFERKTSQKRLYDTVEKLLKGISVEVLPTPTKALRIPGEYKYLDPVTFTSIDSPSEFKRYPATILLTKEPVKTRSWKQTFQVMSKEAEHFPLRNGCSNRAVVECGISYKLAGMSLDTAAERFHNLVLKSREYIGELRNSKRIHTRFKSIYEHRAHYLPRARVSQIDLMEAIFIQKLIETSPFAKQREPYLWHFLIELFVWNKYIINLKAEYVPLPKTLLHRWNERHWGIVKWLKDIGFIEAFTSDTSKKGSYSKTLHSCKYYKIHLELF